MGHDKQIILTGKTGYLGSEIYKLFSKEKISLITAGRKNADINVNLLLEKNVKKKLNFESNNILIHAAGFVPKEIKDYNNQKKNLQNIKIIKNILKTNIKNIIFISSFSVYGSKKKIKNQKVSIQKDTSEYAKSKIVCEKLLLNSKKKVIILRIPGLFGGNRKNGLIYNCIKFLNSKNKMDFTSFPIWTAIHVKDVAVAIKKILNKKFNNKIINLAYKNPMCAEEVIQYLYKIYKKKILFPNKNKFEYKNFKQNLITTSFKNRLKEEVLNYHD